jgi:hypothetical protein
MKTALCVAGYPGDWARRGFSPMDAAANEAFLVSLGRLAGLAGLGLPTSLAHPTRAGVFQVLRSFPEYPRRHAHR